MPISERLTKNTDLIMNEWVSRALKEIQAAHHQADLALRNSLPEYLSQLSDALSTTIDRTDARKVSDKIESTRIGKKHGKERAGSSNYTLDQVIYEYHILRQVICDVLEREKPLTAVEREVIVCSIEQAVNDAATEFSDTLRQIQEQLTQTLAHDFRTPLSSARVNLQLILRKPDNAENCITKASRAISSLDRLDRMIQDLLDASRLKSGIDLGIELKNCDFDWIINEIVSDLNNTYNGRIVYKGSGECRGMWNENGLRRIVENLTINAIKYGDPRASVEIALTQTDSMVSVAVHNEGEPIPKEEMDILFQQFRRSRNAKEKMGWGLGLAVVKGMTEAHKGLVRVFSEKGVGTTFTVQLPKKPN